MSDSALWAALTALSSSAYPLGPGIHGRHIQTRMCAMIAMIVNTMKLVTNREWNSCASASVSPDRDDLSLSVGILTSVCVAVHAFHGDIVVTCVKTGVPGGAAARITA